MKEGRKSMRLSILAELGRIPDDQERERIALEVCRLKPKTKDAVVMIRRYRLGREAKADPFRLWDRLADTVNSYIEAHPSVSMGEIAETLRDMAEHIEEGCI